VTRPAAEPLVCPVCHAPHAAEERFCTACGMPLVHAPGTAAPAPKDSRLAERARKIRPGYAEGPLVRVAGARHQAEAELIQNLLLEEGIPSMVRRSAGFDVPDFLAGGPRDVMVPISGAQTAREVLLQADVIGSAPAGRPVDPGRLLLGLLVALAVGALLVWLLSLAVH
jgi:hypothetical protein